MKGVMAVVHLMGWGSGLKGWLGRSARTLPHADGPMKSRQELRSLGWAAAREWAPQLGSSPGELHLGAV